MKKLWQQFCWFFRIGWRKGLVWVGDTELEETWVHIKTREKRVVRRRWMP